MSVAIEPTQTGENFGEPLGSLFSASEAFVSEFGYLLPPAEGDLTTRIQPAAALVLGYTTPEMTDALDLYYRPDKLRDGSPEHRWQVLSRLKSAGRPLVEISDVSAHETSQSVWVARRCIDTGGFNYGPGTQKAVDLVVELLGSRNLRQSVRAVVGLREKGQQRYELLKDDSLLANNGSAPTWIPRENDKDIQRFEAMLAGFDKQANASFTRVALVDI